MRRQPDITARPYRVTPEVLAQRKQAALDRWAKLEGPDARTLPGRPRKKRPPMRDAKGRFVAVQ